MPLTALPQGYALIALDEAGSTNDEAKDRAMAGAPEGTVIWARQQLAGRGRRGRAWVSPPGNLYLSVILRPACEARSVAQLSFVAALAVLDLVDGPLPGRARCKWPNDILVDGGKIAGILLESALRPEGRVDWVVLGIGVNLASHPRLKGPTPPTSFVDAGALPLAPEDALPSLLAALARRRRDWETQGFAAVRRAWLARLRSPTATGSSSEYSKVSMRRGRWCSCRRTRYGFRSRPAMSSSAMRRRCMLLAVDAGNTNTVFAVFDDGGEEDEAPLGQWRAMTDARRTSDEYAVWLGQLLAQAGLSLADIDQAIVSSVVPQGIGAFKSLCADHCGCMAQVIGEPEVALGIDVNVPRPDEVGADRLVNAVGAHVRHAGALIILDFGTATTFDSVSAEGAYEGGIIAPGIGLSLEALHQAAAQLPLIAVKRPEKVIAQATVPAMQSGIYWGYVGLIEGIVARMKAEIDAPVTTVATGGLAGLFGDATSVIDAVDPDLTIRGLREVHRRNREKQ